MNVYKNQQRIIITGTPISGKTHLSKKLQEKLKFKRKDLDDLFWDKKFSQRSSNEKRMKKIKLFLRRNKSWILDGVYFGDWIKLAYVKADLVIFLDIPKNRLAYRLIFKRYLKKKKNILSIRGWKRMKLIIHNTDLIKEKINSFLDKKSIRDKTIVLRSIKEINYFLNSI